MGDLLSCDRFVHRAYYLYSRTTTPALKHDWFRVKSHDKLLSDELIICAETTIADSILIILTLSRFAFFVCHFTISIFLLIINSTSNALYINPLKMTVGSVETCLSN